jgi:hypothetical protein
MPVGKRGAEREAWQNEVQGAAIQNNLLTFTLEKPITIVVTG